MYMVHFGMQFSHTDLFILRRVFTIFFLIKLTKVRRNYIALGKSMFFKNEFEWLT